MLRRAAALVAVATGSVAIVTALPGTSSAASKSSQLGGAYQVKSTIRIDSQDRYRPPGTAKPTISAITAWRRYTRAAGHPERHPRAGTKTWIGRLTSAHEVTNKLAYGYESVRTFECVTTLPIAHPRKCRQWTFVSARTGKSLGFREQRVKAE